MRYGIFALARLEGMDVLIHIIVFLHILFVATVVGGWIAHFKNPTVTSYQYLGAWGAFISGLLIVGLREMTDGDLNHIKIGFKAVIALIVLVAAVIGRSKAKKDEVVPTGLAHAVGGMALLNMAIASIWV